MAYSMGLLDWLFGERLQMDFPDGQRRSVTKRWFQEMQRRGLIRPAPETRKRIRVHLLNPACRTFPPILPLPEWIDPDIYTVAEWTIGQDVSTEIVRKWLDPGTQELYAIRMLKRRGGNSSKPRFMYGEPQFVTRLEWEEQARHHGVRHQAPPRSAKSAVDTNTTAPDATQGAVQPSESPTPTATDAVAAVMDDPELGDLVAKMVSMAHDKGPHDFRTFIQLAVQSLGVDLAERIGPGLEWAWELVRKEADCSGRMTPAESVAAIVAGMRAGKPSKGRTGTHTQHGRRGGELAARHDVVTDGPRDRSDNRWTGGKAHLVFPTLPPDLRGQSGAMFESYVFTPEVGREVALFLLDDPDFARELGSLKPFHLVAKCGAVETSVGMIAFILWSVSSARGHVVDYEQLLNPFNPDTIDLVAAAARQSRLKVAILDSVSSRTEGFLEFENNFGLNEFAPILEEIGRQESPADFQETRTAFFAEYTLEELKEA